MSADPQPYAPPRGGFEPETAAQFFAQLSEAARQLPDVRATYAALNRIFTRLLHCNTQMAGLHFAGAFAKTDFLLKRAEAPAALRREVNAARVRLRQSDRLADAELLSAAGGDIKALADFTALLYGAEVPPEFAEMAAAQTEKPAAGHDVPYCLRMVVERWDETHLYGRADLEGDDEVCVDYVSGRNVYGYCWAHIAPWLSPGTQLNIIAAREADGVLHPELIVYEPDHLVDISAIAACFETYSEEAVLHLLAKLRPQACTVPVLLGNLAGQLLDEAVHSDGPAAPYAESAQRFFRSNALALLAADGVNKDFHEQARRQREHIHRAISEGLERHVPRFDRREVVLEPSFFCEMLGLQGRMDFLQLDMSVLIEQKAGKAAFPEPHEGEAPRPQEKHYLQMLLYRELLRRNFRAEYEAGGRNLQAFLLYSKYPESLCGVGAAPELLMRALKVRGGIAHCERRLAKGGIRALETLTPDGLNTKGARGPLWERWQRPELAALLRPLHAATPLERSYYYRLMTFTAAEHLLSKTGNPSKENSGFAAKWHDTPAEKRLAGNIYDGLGLHAPAADHSGLVDEVELRFRENEAHDMSNFRPGDIVVLYPYDAGSEPDVRRTPVMRCTIKDISSSRLTLRLRAPQADARLFRRNAGRPWAIEHDFFESSYAPLYRGLHAFLSAPKARRDLLLLRRRPEVNPAAQPEGSYGEFQELVTRCCQARDFFLVIGPPGTGKTSHGLMSIVREELRRPDATLLLLSYTNRAVDEICGKLCEAAIDFMRLGSPLSCAEAYRPQLLENKVADCGNLSALEQAVAATRVFVGTTTAFNAAMPVFRLRRFSLAVIDEASQILEPHLLGLLSAESGGRPAIEKFVLIGDHKQLPAVVQQLPEESHVSEPELREIGLTNCRLSLFERLLRRYRNDPAVTYMLTRQGRMHRDIALFPNRFFYGGTLTEVPLPHQLPPLPAGAEGADALSNLLSAHRVAFIDVAPEADSPARSSDKVNRAEAALIAALVARVHRQNAAHFDPALTVGVIVPYRNQIAAVRRALAAYGIPALADITIDTVERFQGSQREYIIYGFTVRRYYQLDFLTNHVFEDEGLVVDRKLNVVMTRARRHLVLLGDASLLARVPLFARLLEFVRARGSLFSAGQFEGLQFPAIPPASPF